LTITTFGLLRHGQTDWNIDLRLQGTTDIPMNEFGVAQIQQAAERLALQDWDMILTSPLGRARHSAELVAKKLGIKELIEEPLLLERSFGLGEGLKYDEWHKEYASLDDIPGADTAKVVGERARDLLAVIESRHAGAKILGVSHGSLIRVVLAQVSEGAVPPKGERLENASLHLLRHQGSWQLEAWAPQSLS
jgi:broad specificity phosphatase PhoE